jgi:4-amino-4-deoxy-L-arabinose transferase-like glycosyltransferase
MQKPRQSNGTGALYLGTLLLIVILSVLLWSEYKTYHLGTWIVLSAGGVVFWLIGIASSRHSTSASPQVKAEPAESSSELCLKEFHLNGYFFQPVEQETSTGRKQFRLSSTPPLGPDREAAVIRYLINEGLSERMWPQISRRIEEEANWAFFA